MEEYKELTLAKENGDALAIYHVGETGGEGIPGSYLNARSIVEFAYFDREISRELREELIEQLNTARDLYLSGRASMEKEEDLAGIAEAFKDQEKFIADLDKGKRAQLGKLEVVVGGRTITYDPEVRDTKDPKHYGKVAYKLEEAFVAGKITVAEYDSQKRLIDEIHATSLAAKPEDINEAA